MEEQNIKNSIMRLNERLHSKFEIFLRILKIERNNSKFYFNSKVLTNHQNNYNNGDNIVSLLIKGNKN